MTSRAGAEDNSQISDSDHELDLLWSLYRGSKAGVGGPNEFRRY